MRAFHCSWALLLCLTGTAAAQSVPEPTATRTYLIFLNGTPVGREELTVRSDAEGTTISAQARVGAPLNVVTRRVEVRYRADWSPESLVLEGSIGANDITLRTAFSDGSAVSEGMDGDTSLAGTQTVAPQTFILPNIFFGAQEALGRSLAAGGAPAGEFRAFVAPGFDVPFEVRTLAPEQMQTGTSTFGVRRYELVFANEAGETALMDLVTTDEGALVRLNVPAQGLEIIREDVATSTARTEIYSNPGDEPVMIPGPGFNLGATLTRPPGANPSAKLPAVVLLAGSEASDRDGDIAGVPILGQIAGAIAEAGYVAVRYDRRGSGQSGGRAESATIADYTEDARTVVRWLSRRKDIDSKRIAVVGHGEGAWVALLAASREKRIAAVATLAGAASTGADFVLEQQRIALDLADTPAAERLEKVALQEQINAAVLSGKGWESLAPELRRQADTPWFQSVLAYDPARIVDDIRQPMLLVHGQLDRQVPVAHAERGAELARTTSKSRSIELVTVRGVNHLLVPAVTGEVAEYVTLENRNVSQDVLTAITEWLARSFASVR